MKIAIILRELLISGGGERQGIMLALRLKDMGYQVAIYTSAFDARRCFPEETVLVKIKVLPSETLNKIKAENNALLPVALNILRREKILAQAVAGMIEPRTDV